MEVGNIYEINENGWLVMVLDILKESEPYTEVIEDSIWGKQILEANGTKIKINMSDDNGETWTKEQLNRVSTVWAEFIINKGHWKLIHKNVDIFEMI